MDPSGSNDSTTFGSYAPYRGFQHMACAENATMLTVYFSGWWSENNPMNRSLNMLMIMLAATILFSKAVYLLLRPIRQPRIVCDFVVGMIFGSSGFSRIPALEGIIHPRKYFIVTRLLRNIGIIYYTFLMAVKTDPAMLVHSGWTAGIVGVSSAILPFVVVNVAIYFLRGTMYTPIVHGSFSSFLGVVLSITAFPVVGDILAELNLLNTELGRLGLSSSLVHSVFAWFAMAVFTTMIQNESGHAAASLLAMVGMCIFIVLVFGKGSRWVVRRIPKEPMVRDCYVMFLLVSVMGVALLSDIIGVFYIQGPIILGLVVPDGPPLGSVLVEKVELLTMEVLMPFIFFTMGYFMVIPSFQDLVFKWSPMIAIVLLSFAAKLLGAVLAACYCKIPLRKAVMLGLIMNFRGVLEVVIFLYIKHGQLFDWTDVTTLTYMSMLLTGIAVPLVSFYYDPLATNKRAWGRRTIQHSRDHAEFLVLACVHSEDPVPAMINLLEVSNCESTSAMCAYVLHLVELVGRTSSAVIAHKNRKGYINPWHMDRLLHAFINFEQEKQGMVSVQPFTALAPYNSMHQDICSLAVEKKVVLLLLPYPKKEGAAGNTLADHAMRSILPEILNVVPCSVGILVHHGLGSPAIRVSDFRYKVGLLFWGGNDDREALAYASRMAWHPGVTLRVTRIVPGTDLRDETERRLDDQAVEEFKMFRCKHDKVVFKDEVARDMVQTISVMKSICTGHDLILVGRKQGPNCYLSEDMVEWSECPELGVVGDMLSSSDFNCSSLILVMQQQKYMRRG